MNKLYAILFALWLSIGPALSQTAVGTIPGGFPQNFANNIDGEATILTLTAPATGTYLNHRIFTVQSPVTGLDNGAGMTYVIGLDTVPLTKGGTGGITAQAGLNNLADGVAGAAAAEGDILYRGPTNWTRLPRGADGTYLTLSAGIPSWGASPAGAPTDAEYIVSSAHAGLSAEDVATQGDGITITNGAGTATFAVDSTVLRTTGNQSVAGTKTFTDSPVISHGDALVLQGSGFTTSITKADPSANRIFTFPNVADGDVLLTTGAQTISAVKTFSSAPVISSITNTGTLTLPTSTDTLVGRDTTDTLTNKTISSPILQTQVTLDQATADYVLTWDNPGGAGTRSYNISDRGTNSEFLMTAPAEAYTDGGVYFGNGTHAKISGAGTTGQAFISAGTGDPAFGTLGMAGGGTGITSYTAGDILVVNDAGTLVKLPLGANGEVLSVNTAINPKLDWISAGTGTVTSFSATPTGIFDVATATTTPALSLDNQNANVVLAGPSSGSATTPGFRALVDEDLTNNVRAYGGTGGTTAKRTAPTIGTLTGVYDFKGNWNSSGAVTCDRCTLLVDGDVTIDETFTVSTIAGSGGEIRTLQNTSMGGGSGLAPGAGAPVTASNNPNGGAGGGFGGKGGKGGGYAADVSVVGGATYSIEQSLCGSGGGAGAYWTSGGGTGGLAGGGCYIECTGNLTVTNFKVFSANGGAGGAGAGSNDGGGGGGSGGGIVIRALGTVTIDAGSSITANGGNGGNGGTVQAAAGGGGGGGSIDIKCGGSYTNSGTVQASAGTKGIMTGAAVDAGDGGAGDVDAAGSQVVLMRMPF